MVARTTAPHHSLNRSVHGRHWCDDSALSESRNAKLNGLEHRKRPRQEAPSRGSEEARDTSDVCFRSRTCVLPQQTVGTEKVMVVWRRRRIRK